MIIFRTSHISMLTEICSNNITINIPHTKRCLEYIVMHIYYYIYRLREGTDHIHSFSEPYHVI